MSTIFGQAGVQINKQAVNPEKAGRSRLQFEPLKGPDSVNSPYYTQEVSWSISFFQNRCNIATQSLYL